MPAIVFLFAGTKNICPGTRMACSYVNPLEEGQVGLFFQPFNHAARLSSDTRQCANLTVS